MFERYRVIVVTPAGRQRYLRLLAAHVLASPLVDEWHLWCNTQVPDDLAFVHALAACQPRVRVVEPPLEPPNGTATIGQFFRTAIDGDAIYVRMDDDLVWLEREFFPRFLAERVADRDPLFTFPLIINNAICSWLLKTLQRLDLQVPLRPWCLDPVGWQSHELAEALHRWFLGRIRAGTLDQLRFGRITTALARVSITCIAWFGADLRPMRGEFPPGVDEEEYASVTLPMLLGRTNRITGQAIAAHFAFHPQREHLDATDVLARYQELMPAATLPPAP